MRNRIPVHRLGWFGLSVMLLACAPQTSTLKGASAALPEATAIPQTLLDAYTIPPLPDWSDKYAHTDHGLDVRFFRIKKLMNDFRLSRFQAVDLQNHYRHLTATEVLPTLAFERSLAEVRAGRSLSGVDISQLRSAAFIVVYDLDETLYQAFYKTGARGPTWHDFSFQSRGQDVYVKLRPGWVQAVQKIHQLGGMVVLFTARADDVAESAARQWMHAGKNIRELVDGFFSKSHLVLQEKTDGDPIVVPTKDLRFLDESLEKVIIVDDNPRRVFQHHRQRLIKKFQADPYLEDIHTKFGASTLVRSFEQTLPMVVREIEEAVVFMRAHVGTTFAQAYLPYTMLGKVAMEALINSGLSESQARDYIRKNPSYVEEAF